MSIANPTKALAPNFTIPGWGIPGATMPAVTDWDTALAPLKLFRVRGFGWFKRMVEPAVSNVVPLIVAAQNEALSRLEWKSLGFDWEAPFAARQVYDAENHKPLQFAKAALVLLLCEIAARAAGVAEGDVAANMRIEPAIFGIVDFDRPFLNRAIELREDLLVALRKETAQDTQHVFWDMADRVPVSYRLATLTRDAWIDLGAKPAIDEVIVLRTRKSPSAQEKIEGDSVPARRAA